MPKQKVWWNGKIVEASKVRISPFDRGFQYGDGLFETIRIQNGFPLFLEEHLERLRKSLSYLEIDPHMTPHVREVGDFETCRSIIRNLILENGLDSRVSRLKIMVSRGEVQGFGLPPATEPTVIVTVSLYNEPSDEIYNHGWKGIVLQNGFTPSIAHYKTISYLFYLWARHQAISKGADEVIISDKDGFIAEGSMTGLIMFDEEENSWIAPVSPWQLPSITVGKVIEILRELGEQVEVRSVHTDRILLFETVWALNSMIGVMPFRSIGKYNVKSTRSDLAKTIRQRLFQISR